MAATITKTKLWKKMAVHADKIKTEVKKINKSPSGSKPTTPEQEVPTYHFANESPLNKNYSNAPCDEDEGIYEDFSGSNASEYSFAEEKAASAEDIPSRYNNSPQRGGNHLGLPHNALQSELKEFHLKTASLPRNVRNPSNLHAPTQMYSSRSMENVSQPRPKTPIKQAYRPHRSLQHTQNESKMVENVLYHQMDASASSFDTDDALSQNADYSYSVQRRNLLYSSSSTTSDEHTVYAFADGQPPQNAPEHKFKFTVNGDNNTKSVTKIAMNPGQYIKSHSHGAVTELSPDFEDEPVFGTIEMRYASTYEPVATNYEDLDESVYHEPGNFYDFE